MPVSPVYDEEPIDYPIPPAVGQYSQPIVLKVSEAKGPPRNHLHLEMEALGDAVAFAETPHCKNGLHPAGQGLGQRS